MISPSLSSPGGPHLYIRDSYTKLGSAQPFYRSSFHTRADNPTRPRQFDSGSCEVNCTVIAMCLHRASYSSIGSSGNLSPGIGTIVEWTTPPISKWLWCPQHSSHTDLRKWPSSIQCGHCNALTEVYAMSSDGFRSLPLVRMH